MPVLRTRPDACPGVLAPHDAADGALARIRLPGGAISAAALLAVASCADELGDGRMHLTSRGNLQLRGLSRSSALVVRLTAAGLLPSVTHERVRNVLASPFAGLARDPVERLDVAASTTMGARGAGSPASATNQDRLLRSEAAAAGAADARGPGSPADDGDPGVQAVEAPPATVGARGAGSPALAADQDRRLRSEVAAARAADARGTGSSDVRQLAVALDRGLCSRPELAALPGRFLFALDDGRGDVAAEGPDLCWQAPDRLLVGGVDTGLCVPAADAVTVLLDAAEAFLALRKADGGSAWRAAELADSPARIGAELTGGDGTPRRSSGPVRVAGPGWQQGGLTATTCTQSHLADTPEPRPASAHIATAAGAPANMPHGVPANMPHGVPANMPHGAPANMPHGAPANMPHGVPANMPHGAPASMPHGAPAAATPGPVVRDDGGVALVVAPLLGELTSAQARLLADAGPSAIVTPWRTIVLPDPAVSTAAVAAAGLVIEPGPAAEVSACAGRPGCAKALADVRADTLAAVGHLPAGRMHVSGCARRCGAPRGPHVDAVALAGGGYLVDGVPRPGLAQ